MGTAGWGSTWTARNLVAAVPSRAGDYVLGIPSSNNSSRPDSKEITTQRLVVVGYLLALAVPPLGFAVGLVLMVSPTVRSKHSVLIVLVSILAAGIWALLISAGALTSTNQGY